MSEIKTKNRMIAEYVFDKIRSFGFEPYDIDYGNGYFLFDFGKDSVVHFRLKGVWRHWKFGMWIHGEYLSGWWRYLYEKEYGKDNKYNVVEIFCQYDHDIDKFKPSASSLRVDYNVNDWTNRENFPHTFWELEAMLKMIQRHPFMCYDGFCGEYAGYKTGSFLSDFIKYEFRWYWKRIKKITLKRFWYLYTKVKIYLAKNNKCIKDVEFHDFNAENPGWETSYLYNVVPVFTRESTEDEQLKWMNRWFKKEEYGRIGFDSIVDVKECKIEGSEKIYYFS